MLVYDRENHHQTLWVLNSKLKIWSYLELREQWTNSLLYFSINASLKIHKIFDKLIALLTLFMKKNPAWFLFISVTCWCVTPTFAIHAGLGWRREMQCQSGSPFCTNHGMIIPSFAEGYALKLFLVLLLLKAPFSLLMLWVLANEWSLEAANPVLGNSLIGVSWDQHGFLYFIRIRF